MCGTTRGGTDEVLDVAGLLADRGAAVNVRYATQVKRLGYCTVHSASRCAHTIGLARLLLDHDS
jgi:hypothetical protein